MAKYRIISKDKGVQKRYVEALKNGCSDAMAEMLAVRKPPGFDMKYSPMHPRKNRGRGR